MPPLRATRDVTRRQPLLYELKPPYSLQILARRCSDLGMQASRPPGLTVGCGWITCTSPPPVSRSRYPTPRGVRTSAGRARAQSPIRYRKGKPRARVPDAETREHPAFVLAFTTDICMAVGTEHALRRPRTPTPHASGPGWCRIARSSRRDSQVNRDGRIPGADAHGHRQNCAVKECL